MRRLTKFAKRWLILGHRWLGIVTGLFFVAWVGSGLVMMYVAFPALTEAERLAGLAPIAPERVMLTPDAALARAGLMEPRAFSLMMRGTEPVYRPTAADGRRLALSAATGEPVAPLDPDDALALARTHPGAGASLSVRSVERDQWSVTARYDPLRPFHVVSLDDPAGTEIYLSERTGEVALDTTRRERFWNWLGAIPHWIYPTPLRANVDLWRDVVLWISGLGIAGALSGLVIGIWRIRPRRPYPHGSATPYHGLARWHHLAGLIGGLTLLTFVASGWLSMNPNRWFSGSTPPAAMLAGYAGEAGAFGIGLKDLRRAVGPGAVEIRFTRIAGRTLMIAAGAQGRRVAGADGRLGPDEAEILAAAARLLPGTAVAGVERLTDYDAYWYPHREVRLLPVLRVRFDDAASTWFHIDPATGEVLQRLDRSGRINRWLFSALHRLDLPVLILHRPAWDIVQWVLNALGGVIAVTGVVLGWRRLRRPRRRAS